MCMSCEQTQSADEDHMIQSRAPALANKWTLSRDGFVNKYHLMSQNDILLQWAILMMRDNPILQAFIFYY